MLQNDNRLYVTGWIRVLRYDDYEKKLEYENRNCLFVKLNNSMLKRRVTI